MAEPRYIYASKETFDRLMEIAEATGSLAERGTRAGKPSVATLVRRVAQGEIIMRQIERQQRWFEDYEEARACADQTGLPLWDTHSRPWRYLVGHLTIEQEDDFGDQDWTEVLD